MANKKTTGKGSARVAGLFFFIFVLGFSLAYLFKSYNAEEVEEVSPVPVEIAVPTAPAVPTEPPTNYQAKVVIIIDDMGYSIDKVREIIDFGVPITVAVIPFLSHSTDTAFEAGANGLELLLHLPMEPSNLADNNPGKGALLTNMSSAELRSNILKGLREVPGAVGINNHMGSRFTENSEKMSIVVDVVKEKDLFFIDSRTSSKSVAENVAREAGLKTIERNIFLDNEQDEDYIRGQIERLKKIALKKGVAVAIGHPYKETLKVLKEDVGRFKEEGIELVRLKEVIY